MAEVAAPDKLPAKVVAVTLVANNSPVDGLIFISLPNCAALAEILLVALAVAAINTGYVEFTVETFCATLASVFAAAAAALAKAVVAI